MDWIVPVANAVAAGVLPFVIVEEMEHKEFCAVESACLDFKRDGYHDDAESLANAVKDIASLYNTYGGFIVFGVDEVEKDVRYKVVGIDGTPFNMQQLRGKVDAWLTNKIDFSYDEVKLKCGPTIGVVFVHKRPASERPNQFKRRGPEIKPGRYAFDAGNVAMRRGDKSVLASEMADWQLILGDRKPDILAKEIGRLVQTTRSGAALDHNLPSSDLLPASRTSRL
jgi:predicted HTH transcriptional regulator